MKSLVLYSTISGGFYKQSEELDQAIGKAKARVGDDVWKKGFSDTDPNGATAALKDELKAAGITPVQVEGKITNVSFVENKDAAGNVYPKLRTDIVKDDEQLIVSVDLKSDVAQRMITKLNNCKPGDDVRISAWPSPVEKGGRQYINHAVSIKDSTGTEVKTTPEFSETLKNATDGVEASLKAAGIQDKQVINTAKTSKRISEHKDMLLKIQDKFQKK